MTGNCWDYVSKRSKQTRKNLLGKISPYDFHYLEEHPFSGDFGEFVPEKGRKRKKRARRGKKGVGEGG